MHRCYTIVGILSLCLTATMAAAETDESRGWLLDAEEEARYERLQSYLGGFSAAMWEVGYRYEALHTALERQNFALAEYHWEKIKSAIEGGYLKRPGRQANSDKLFLDKVWPEVQSALASGEPKRAWQGFETAKAACLTCHVAEDVGFMNNQPLFDLSAPASD